MSKLLLRLSDASKSGVYRTSRTDEIEAATRGSALDVAHVDLAGAADRSALLARFAAALGFPAWFGGNWDALEDCLSDLSWRPAAGHVLLVDRSDGLSADDHSILTDVLAAAAAGWRERGRPFFAVFVGGAAALPELYRRRG